MQQTESLHFKFDLGSLSGLKDVSIYVGGLCNFNCRYCDRDFVKSVGVQKMPFERELTEFLMKIFETSAQPMISFHGGETLLYISTIEKIVSYLVDEQGMQPRFFVQTNGSLILKNQDFFSKYAKHLYVSISYDFVFQTENRSDFDIEETLGFLDKLGIQKQIQYVIPTNRRDAFDVAVFSKIVSFYKKYQINSLNLILLRHRRGLESFETIICKEDIDLKRVFTSLIQFVQLLYVSGINVAIDGHSSHIDKDYYSDHKQIVLSPDGHIYPEYQFIEYKHPEFRMGRWKSPVQLDRSHFPESGLSKMRPDCKKCDAKNLCGLQYYYAMFDIDPPDTKKCTQFYQYLELSLRHLFKLKKHKTLLESIGV